MPVTEERSRSQLLAEQGYLVVEDVFDPDTDLQPLYREYADLLDQLASELYAEGRITSTYAELPFEQRLIQVTKENGHSLSQRFDISLPLRGGLSADTPIHLGPAAFNVLTNSSLLDVVEEFVGPEIICNPVQHFRAKLPEGTVGLGDGLISPIPWHQDNGVVLEEADQTEMLTVWVALNDAPVERSCMQVIPTRRGFGLQDHCISDTRGVLIPERNVETERTVQLPMRAGSVLFMHSRTPHSSTPNTTTDEIRMSLDLRYQPAGTPTGRPMFPEFIARSRAHPESELHDWRVWAQMWRDARAALAKDEPIAFNRWGSDSPMCA